MLSGSHVQNVISKINHKKENSKNDDKNDKSVEDVDDVIHPPKSIWREGLEEYLSLASKEMERKREWNKKYATVPFDGLAFHEKVLGLSMYFGFYFAAPIYVLSTLCSAPSPATALLSRSGEPPQARQTRGRPTRRKKSR